MVRLFCFLLGLIAVHAMANQEYRAWLAAQQRDFSHYVNQQQIEFAKWLNQDWVQADSNVVAPQVLPKPEQLPILPFEPDIKQEHTLEPDFHSVIPEQPDISVVPPAHSVKVDFYGLEPQFDIPPSLRKAVLTRAALSDWWNNMATAMDPQLLRSLAAFKQAYYLNDWDMLFFLEQLSKQLFRQPKAQTAWTWFIGIQMEMDLRLLETGDQWFIGYNSLQVPVAIPYVTLGQKRYFMFAVRDQSLRQVKTYPEFSGFDQLQPLNMQQNSRLYLGEQWRNREIDFSFNHSQWHMTLPYNVYRVEHTKVYPQLQLKDYLNTPWPQSLQDSVQQQLQVWVGKMPEHERWEFLLAMVQQGFAYETDQQQFGKEKYLTAEEMLFYPYSDCEDRSYFLKGLLKAVAPETIIGVRFPNHVALGVLDNNNDPDDYSVRLNGNVYVLLDPSYLNAGPGQLMPGLSKQTPEAIVLN